MIFLRSSSSNDSANIIALSGQLNTLSGTLSTISTTVSTTVLGDIQTINTTLSGVVTANLNNSIYIQQHKIAITKNELGEHTIGVKWNSANKDFLKYSPKYFLFRYRGQGKHGNYQPTARRKGFTHPVHLNGAGKEGSAWYAGASYTSGGGHHFFLELQNGTYLVMKGNNYY